MSDPIETIKAQLDQAWLDAVGGREHSSREGMD